MGRKPLSILAAVMLLFGLAVAPVAAHTHSPTHYNGQCNEAPTGHPNGIIWARHSTSVGRVLGASSIVTARALSPCLNGDGANNSLSFLAAANLQGNGTNSVYQFVQIGMAKIDGQTPQICTGKQAFTSGQTTFVFTIGNNSGVICKADWFDPDNNGTPNDPVGGVDYKFSINETNSGGANNWTYCITIVSTGVGDCLTQSRATPDGGLADGGGNPVAWWGCEVGNTANAMGVPFPNSKARIRQSAYEKATNPGVWNYTENSAPYAGWTATLQNYYSWTQSQTGLGESVDCTTSSHTF
jgi:hypothetical protein